MKRRYIRVKISASMLLITTPKMETMSRISCVAYNKIRKNCNPNHKLTVWAQKYLCKNRKLRCQHCTQVQKNGKYLYYLNCRVDQEFHIVLLHWISKETKGFNIRYSLMDVKKNFQIALPWLTHRKNKNYNKSLTRWSEDRNGDNMYKTNEKNWFFNWKTLNFIIE